MDFDQVRAAYDALPAHVELEVTPRDIAQGRRRDCNRCPLALSAERTFRELTGIGDLQARVAASIYLTQDDRPFGRYWYENDAGKFIDRTDNGKITKPGTYTVHKPGTGPVDQPYI